MSIFPVEQRDNHPNSTKALIPSQWNVYLIEHCWNTCPEQRWRRAT